MLLRTLQRVGLLATVTVMGGCVTLYGGTRQPITVASAPPGAEVFLNSQPVGTTPVEVTVGRGDPVVLRVEQPGRRPTVIRPERQVTKWIAIDLAVGGFLFYATVGALIGGGEGDLSPPVTALALLAGAAPTVVDFHTGAAYSYPRRVVVSPQPRSGRAPIHEGGP